MNAAPDLGLSCAQAAALLLEAGPNEIRRQKTTAPWRLLLGQFLSPVIGLLIAACIVSAVMGELANALAIGAIVIVNGLVGFVQEYRAERALQALRAMTAPRARVIRDGRSQMIPAAEVVPGDVLLLEAGDVVAADARLIEAHALTTNEAALTGESLPVEKAVGVSDATTPLAERRGYAFLGTAVVAGSGMAEVTGTGMQTELGRIAHLLEEVRDEATPLQHHLARVGVTLLSICLVIVVIVAGLGLLRGEGWLSVLMSAVSLAVAAVPEGLPAIVTVALALGVQRMASRNVLVRRLPAVETLGCASVICTDKTGTLTTGVMAVRELWGPDETRLLDAAAANCDAELGPNGHDGTGDPTELAILAVAASKGMHRAELERDRPRVTVHPFDAQRKRMSIHRADGLLYVKGAVETVLPLCRDRSPEATQVNAQMAGRGLRVLAVAVGRGPQEEDLELVGLIGMADPPRREAIEAVAAAHGAGIRTVMITGDHPVTAAAIAREMGILRDGEKPGDSVHARATPEDKLRIVREWKSRGAVVAMTGDGVNDAPALREADIGIAMGRTGTEVSREAADMVLADDNFASIVAAVEEGRGIFDNIRKTLVYLLAGNAGELAVMLVAALVGLPLPLLPLHLLWINLVTDGLPALALVTDPVDGDVLKRPPRARQEAILGRKEWQLIALTALFQAAATLGVFIWALQSRDLLEARNLAFSTLVFGELLRAFSARSADKPIWEIDLLSNLRLLVVVAGSFVLQIGIHHVPVFEHLLDIGPLGLQDCLLTIAIGCAPTVLLETLKWSRRHRFHGRQRDR